MTQLRLCLQTQTPVVRPLKPVPAGTSVDDLREGEDYLASPGGVTRMLRGLVRQWDARGRLREPAWVSLAQEDASLRLGTGTRVDLVSLPPHARGLYAEAKSALWDEIHDLGEGERPASASIAAGLRILGERVGAHAAALHARDPFDLFYVHDFQLLESTVALPDDVPRVFRWHVPVRPITRDVRDYVARALDEFDAVIVSTEAYAREMRAWGVRTPIHASYPYLDPSRQRVVTPDDLAAFDARHGLKEDDVVFVNVARMDPMKSQDVAIRALARIAPRVPTAKLLLVGGGGFSGGRAGLGLPRADEWRQQLVALARELGVADRVVFAGGVNDEELDVAITRARALLLPSALEGFGLAAIEGWLYGRPVIVSATAGVSELVHDDENGYVFPAGDDVALAGSMERLAADEAHATRLGEAGRVTARACHLDKGAEEIWEILGSTVRGEPTWSPRERWSA